MTTTPNRQFQHYEVLRRPDGSLWELGRGAMGITYKAYDVNLCCEVALKVVNATLLDNTDARERFVREARAAAALRHRHVASVYHLGNDGEHFFYAMEFIDGENLDTLVRRQGPLPVGAVLKIILQVAKALVAADRQRLVHRDIKPANLMIVHDDADEDWTIKVIDFGLARPTSDSETAAPLTLGGFVGTPQYASPEQLEERPLDARSDIYSLGVTAWFLLTGHPPFSGSLAMVCQQQLSSSPPWHTLAGELPDRFRRLLEHMLEKAPERRPQSARALRAEVEDCWREIPPDAARLTVSGTLPQDASVPGQRVNRGATTVPPPQSFAMGRYTVVACLGEDLGGTLYRVRDTEEDWQLFTLRCLSAEWLAAHGAGQDLAEEIRHIQAAAHPHLVNISAFKPARGDSPALLIEEALVSFSLRDLLAARGGSLPPGMVLALAWQAADALDHAQRCRLAALELSLPSPQVHFPFADPAASDDAMREVLGLPLADWPAWSLKIHPLAAGVGRGDQGTWAGDVTLIHPLRKPAMQGESANGNVAKLARLIYELLGGTPDANLSRSRRASLSSLSESGNAVLAAAFSDDSAYADCNALCQALAATVAERCEIPSGALDRGPNPPSVTAAKSSLPQRFASGPFLPVERTSTWSSAGLSPDTTIDEDPWRVASCAPDDSHDGASANTAWDRLSLARSHDARPGRWLLGAGIAAVVFLSAFAGVFAVLIGRSTVKASNRSVTGDAHGALSLSPNVLVQNSPESTGANAAPPARRLAAVPSDSPSIKPSASLPPPPPVTDPTPAASAVTTATSDGENTPVHVASVHVTSDPIGAAIWWHDKLVGITPTQVSLPSGDQVFIARKKGSLDTQYFFRVEPERDDQTVLIRLMAPNLVPTWRDTPVAAAERSPHERSGIPGHTPDTVAPRVRPAIPLPSAGRGQIPPVLQSFPLQPFERRSTGNPPEQNSPTVRRALPPGD